MSACCDRESSSLTSIEQALGCDVQDLGIAIDDPDVLRDRLQAAAANSDLVLTTGGVSLGEEDHVRNIIAALGRIELWRLAIKPGKPVAFGCSDNTPLLGLPGNPASVFVTFCLLARPAILRLQTGREGWPTIEIYPNQGSGVLRSTSWANGLAIIPEGSRVCRGDLIPFLLFIELLC